MDGGSDAGIVRTLRSLYGRRYLDKEAFRRSAISMIAVAALFPSRYALAAARCSCQINAISSCTIIVDAIFSANARRAPAAGR